MTDRPDHLGKQEWRITPEQEEREKSQLWSMVHKHEGLVNRAIEPSIVPDILAPTRQRNPRQQTRADIGRAHRDEQFVAEFENMWYQTRGEVDWGWLIQQDPEDLRLIDPEIAQFILRAGEAAQDREVTNKAQQDALNSKLDARLQGRERLFSLAGNLLRFAQNPAAKNLGVQMREFSGEDIDREAVLAAMMDLEKERAKTPAERADLEPTLILQAAQWMKGAFGNLISNIAETSMAEVEANGVLNAPAPTAALGVVASFLRQRAEERYEALRPPEFLPEDHMEAGKALTQEAVWQLWEEMQEVNPGLVDTYMQMGLGDPMRAFGFFFADQTEHLPEDQLAQIGQQFEAAMHEQLDEFDYRFSSEVLDVLAAYTHHGPMKFMTGYHLLLTDEDVRSEALAGRFEALAAAVEEADHSVAKVYGIDGTALGLATDLTSAIVGDPLTYVFGPKTVRSAKIRTAKDAAKLAKSKPVQRLIDDVTKAIADGDVAQAVVMTAWMDDAGYISRFINKADEAVDAARTSAAVGDEVAEVLPVLKHLDREAVEHIVTQAILDGALPPNAFRTTVRPAAVSYAAKDDLNKLPFGEWWKRFTAQMPRVTTFELHGPGHWSRITQMVNHVWGNNRAAANHWMSQLARAKASKSALAAERLTDPLYIRAQAVGEELTFLQDQVAHGAVVAHAEELGDVAAVAEMQRRIFRAQNELDDLRKQLGQKYRMVDDQRDVEAILQQMYETFNREHIATLPAWKPFVNDEGIVPWHVLRGTDEATEASMTAGQRFFSDEALKGDPTLETIAQELSGILNTKMNAVMPIPALDMVMASTWGGSRYLSKIRSSAVADNLRETAWTMHRLWVIDRVMTPATAAVVSFDELMRIFHRYGHDATMRWMKDRIQHLEARAAAAITRNGISPQAGSASVRKAVQERLTELQEMPAALRNAERSTFEGMGQGYMDIAPGDPGYIDAARRFSGQFIQDPAFRAYLQGEDVFRAWWNDPGVAQSRPHVINAQVTKWEDAYKGWETMYNYLTAGARKAGNYDDVNAAWRAAAARADEIGGQALVEMPQFVFENLGTVRGIRKVAPSKFGPTNIQNAFFDKMFMEPTNARRGFVHSLAVEHETARLEQLFASQGKRVVSYEELAHQLGLRSGVGLDQSIGPVLDDLARRSGLVTEGYIRRLAEAHALDEIHDLMYAWDSSSRLGRQTKGIFPFGGPWADMWGFWGREMMTKPHLRGWINEANFFGLGDHVRGALNATPINPRVPALISRLADTDFTIDRGWVPWDGDDKEGLLPGSERTDLSPLFFLPTGGDTPFQVLIPPFGYLPIGMLDLLVQHLADPVTQPKEYQELITAISDFLPGMQYTTGPAMSDAIGGGTFGKMAGITMDLTAIGSSLTGGRDLGFYGVSRFFGDIGREVDRTRAISALMADPEVLETLLAAADEDTVDLLIQSYAAQASRDASTAHLAKVGSRVLIPAQNKFNTSLDEITDVWIEAAGQFPDLGVRPGFENLDLTDEDNKRTYANDVRRAFFALPQWRRDLYVAQYPQLAVNLVASWKWTESALNDLGIEGQFTYRTDGTDEGLARHQVLIDQGYIMPIEPMTRAYQIFGLMRSSRENAVKEVYSLSAQNINEYLWSTTVSEKSLALMEWVLETGYGAAHGIHDVRTLWENWGSLESDAERWITERSDAPPQRVKEFVAIPTKERAWSTSWPGMDNVSARFAEVTFTSFPEDVQTLISGLDMDLEPGVTGIQLFQAIENELTDKGGSPLWNMAKGPYDAYLLERTAAGTAAADTLRDAAAKPDADPEWKSRMWDFIRMADNISDRVRSRPGPATRDEMEQVQSSYLALYGTDPEVPWGLVWKNLYERTYGKLDWVQPEPPELRVSGGQISSNAYTPIVRRVVDGDTLIVSKTTGPDSFFGLGGHEGQARAYTVRLIGLRSPEFGQDNEAAQAAKERLQEALVAGVEAGKRIYLVRDPDNFGNTDRYGRELAWIFIGDEPYFDREAFLPTD
jgi:endonuclease YncB( thermonuclease family)